MHFGRHWSQIYRAFLTYLESANNKLRRWIKYFQVRQWVVFSMVLVIWQTNAQEEQKIKVANFFHLNHCSVLGSYLNLEISKSSYSCAIGKKTQRTTTFMKISKLNYAFSTPSRGYKLRDTIFQWKVFLLSYHPTTQ